MDIIKFSKMLSSGVFLHKDRKRLTISVPKDTTASEIEAVKALVEMEGWKEVLVTPTHVWESGCGISSKYINPEDEPKQLPGHVYA